MGHIQTGFNRADLEHEDPHEELITSPAGQTGMFVPGGALSSPSHRVRGTMKQRDCDHVLGVFEVMTIYLFSIYIHRF